MKFRWNYNETEDLPIFEQIIENRQIDDTFLFSDFNDIPSYSLLKDIEKATTRILDALTKNQKIMIYGHDDVDGVSATYILFDFLGKIGFQNHFYYIPNRLLENHGFSVSLMQKLLQDNYDLLVTVDGGISEFSNIENLNELGIDVIITDHHLVPDITPDAFAIVNPKQPDCKFPDKMLAGVTVSYFLVKAIAAKLDFEIDENYLFWVAVGTIADKVPMLGVNRLIVKEVIDRWFLFDDPALLALKPYIVTNPGYEQRIGSLKYIARLLSNGRQPFGEHQALNFLLAPKSEKEIIIKNLVREQRDYDARINQVSELLEDVEIDNGNCIVYFDENDRIEVNLMGFAASQLSSKYKIPSVILKKRDGVISGEARATKGFCLIKAFGYCKEVLIQFGGHSRAAGFTTKQENLNVFIALFNAYCDKKKDTIKFYQKLSIDAVFSIDQIDMFYDYLQTEYHLLQPFGQGNRNPTFLLKNYCPEKDWHKFKLKDSKNKLEFNKTYDILFKFKSMNFYLVDYKEVEN